MKNIFPLFLGDNCVEMLKSIYHPLWSNFTYEAIVTLNQYDFFLHFTEIRSFDSLNFYLNFIIFWNVCMKFQRGRVKET